MATQLPEDVGGRDVALSLERGSLLRGGREIRLRAKTLQVLVALHERHGRLVTKEELFRTVWPDTFVSDDSLTKCIREIREALGDDDHQRLKTVARQGFILETPLATVRRGEAHTSAAREPAERPTHNLPAPLTTFIGRHQAIADLLRLLPSTRLLTLTGAGGCGKTRLALEIARRVLDDFCDGVWLADLSPLGEPGLVAHSVASILDVRQAPGRSLVDSLADRLRQRQMLLVLDNCEHVISSATELAGTLLGAAPGLTILATSREVLGVAGERTWRVPSLTVPEAQHPWLPADLLSYEAVHLLAERGAAVDAGFTITTDNARTAAEVCRRLDGVPLAIELAAARLNVLSLEQINARLDDRFRLLTRTDRTTAGRRRTLQATVDWSYDLLTETERRLLGRLSAFAGGWTLGAAELVCADDGIEQEDVLDVMTRLVDKSLVIVDAGLEGGDRRYRFLETVRQYARERLQQSGEGDSVRARHFEFYLDLARRAEPELMKGAQLLWLGRLQAEHDNLRAALEWRLTSHHPGADCLELAAALHWFWLKRAYLAEGQQYLERALAVGRATAPQRAAAVMALGSIVFFQGHFEEAERLLENSAAMAHDAGDPATVAIAVGLLTLSLLERGDLAGASERAAESAAAARAAGMPSLEAFSLTFYAYQALFAGDIDRAGEAHETSLALLRTHGDLWGIAIVLYDLALLRVIQRRYPEARALCAEGIALGRQFSDRRAIAWCLGLLAGADAAEGQFDRAARLRGAMEALLDSVGAPAQPTYQLWIGDRLFPAVQEQLGRDRYQQALQDGRKMSVSQALEYARIPFEGGQ